MRIMESEDRYVEIFGVTTSRLHRFVGDFRSRNHTFRTMVAPQNSKDEKELNAINAGLLSAYVDVLEAKVFMPFLICHDWTSGEFGQIIAPLEDDEWRVPFDWCVFEIGARLHRSDMTHKGRVFVFVKDTAESDLDAFIEVYFHVEELNLIFHMFGTEGKSISDCMRKVKDESNDVNGQWAPRLLSFVRAACIAMEMDCAVPEEIRVPPKLNAARVRRGKIPLRDYKIINVAKHRIRTTDSTGESTGRRVRAHARRGHWWPRITNTESRFDRFRHWRDWKLVGDIDLGYIHHEYKI